MGRIDDGTIRGTLPDHVAFAVDYPGYPTSVERALQTLGGEAGVGKVRTSQSNFLELKFRPEDPFAHPAFGELRHTSDLVLRLSKKIVKRPSGSQAKSNAVDYSQDILVPNEFRQTRTATGELEGQAQEVEAEIIAKVEHTYTFDGMADYQYVMAVHAANGSNGHKQKGMEEIPFQEVNSNEMTMLVPPLFSTKDIPEEIFLRLPVGKKRKQLVIDQAEEQAMQAPCFALDFKIKEVPKEGNWELDLTRGSEAWLRTAALVRLFQERPVWTRTMLSERLVGQGLLLTQYCLKTSLFRIAYYFGSGPFRNLWIRNGYDPRADPESRAYQMIDFRVPFALRGQPEEPSPPPKNWHFSELCSFKIKPHKKFTQFQLIDLQDDEIQAQIESPPQRTTCSETTGWYRLSTMKRLRQVLRLRYLALFPGKITRALEAVERRNWERSKLEPETEREKPIGHDRSVRMTSAPEAGQDDCDRVEEGANEKTTLDPFSIPDQVNGVDLNAVDDDEEDDDEDDGDIAEDVDHLDDDGLKTNIDDDEEEDDEEEEEELEEDTQELLSEQGVAQDQMPPYLDPTDNIPQNYLQALLGKFASNNNGDERPSALELDDHAQYAIYESDEDEDD